ncbi:hypothetical protein BC828DRAFT_41873 [Blastocladiella britannica]|nr:hypothetical protein BC828DRAFT_41873 [Blastocladiella britannica]
MAHVYPPPSANQRQRTPPGSQEHDLSAPVTYPESAAATTAPTDAAQIRITAAGPSVWASTNLGNAWSMAGGDAAAGHTLTSQTLSPTQLTAVQQAWEKHANVGISMMDFGLNVLEMDRLELFGLTLAMAAKLRVLELLEIEGSLFLDFVIAVDAKYHPNPYHSFSHAVDVTFMCFFTLTTLRAAELLTDLEQLTIFFAALCHDLCHPGRNNTFMISTRSELAVRYQNASVLENYSIEIGHDMLQELQLLAKWPEAAQSYFFEIFTDLILATDMSKHFSLVKELGELSQQLLKEDQLAQLVEEESLMDMDDSQNRDTMASADSRQLGVPIAGAGGRFQLTHSLQEALDQASGTPGTVAVGPPRLLTASPATVPSTLPPSLDYPAAPPRRLSISKSEASLHRSDDNDNSINARDARDIALPHSAVQSQQWMGGSAGSFAPSLPTPLVRIPTPPTSDPYLVDTCGIPSTGALILLTDTQRRSLSKILLHAADISNTVRPWEMCKRWSDLVEREHFAQGDAEAALGLDLSSANMDRVHCQQAKVSIDFSDIIIYPFFVLLADVLPAHRSLRPGTASRASFRPPPSRIQERQQQQLRASRATLAVQWTMRPSPCPVRPSLAADGVSASRQGPLSSLSATMLRRPRLRPRVPLSPCGQARQLYRRFPAATAT